MTLALLVLPQTASAQAGRDELTLTLSPEWAAAPNFRAANRGVGGSASVFWGPHDWVSFGVRAGGHHLIPTRDSLRSDRPSDVFSAFAGTALIIDALQVVPFVTVMPGVITGAPCDPPGPRFAVRASLGLDFRPRRRWSFGAEIAWHGVAGQSGFPGYSVFAFRASHIVELGGL